VSASLEAIAARDPGSVVLTDASGQTTARDLLAAVENRAEQMLAAQAECVASRIDNGREALAIELAARHAGLAYVPLPPFFSPRQVEHALARSGAGLLYLDPGVRVMPGWRLHGGDAQLQWLVPSQPLAAASWPHSTRCITFTSGSTGEARGVCLDAASIDRVALSLFSATHALRPRRHLCVLPLSTLLEQVAGIHAAALADAEILLPTMSELGYSGAAGLDPGQLLACIDRHRPESLILLPQLLFALVTLCEAGRRLPSSLRFIAVGGGRVGTRLLARAHALGLPVYEGYGLSECGSVVCLNRPGAVRAGSVGRPLPHATVRVDARGEIHVEGASALAYLGDACRMPASLPTGDIGRVDDDGFVHVEGRLKHQFVTSFGRNVSPEWVESELQQHAAIAQAVVFGEARPFNVAVLVARDPGTCDSALERAVRAVNAGLPDYARVERFIRRSTPLGAEDGMLTANGRPRRDAIARRHALELDALYATGTTLEGALIP
jgi:long-chain acyl-CoA synthetase